MGAWLELFLLPKLSISQRFLPKQMPLQMSRAFGSAQGPATSLYANKALENLLANLPGTAQRGNARSPADLRVCRGDGSRRRWGPGKPWSNTN